MSGQRVTEADGLRWLRDIEHGSLLELHVVNVMLARGFDGDLTDWRDSLASDLGLDSEGRAAPEEDTRRSDYRAMQMGAYA